MTRLTALVDLLKGYSSRPCIDCDAGIYSYLNLVEEVDRWRDRLCRLDVKPGAVIAVRADYSLGSIATLISLLLHRAVAALVPRDQSPQRYVQDCYASALLDVRTDGTYHWQPLVCEASHPLLDRIRAANDGGFVLFTSGSTGPPKAALQSTERFLYKFRKPGRSLSTLAFLLFDHVAGLDTVFYTLVSGGTLVLTRKRDPSSIASLIAARGVEVLPTSPSFLRLLCVRANELAHNLSGLKVITYGSEAMDPATLAKLNTIFPHIQITQKYGTTEFGSPKTISRGNESLWLKFRPDGLESKVVDNVLWIRSESIFLGYLNAQTPVDEEGWYCTSDLVDVDGPWIRFRGRVSDVINVGGEKVSPGDVENCILELDFVREAVVRGEPNSMLGEIVTAQVAVTALELDRKTATTLIWQHCRRKLGGHKAPVRIEIVATGLTNDRQKSDRRRDKS